MQNASHSSLNYHLTQLAEPRLHRRPRHSLHDFLVIAITSLLYGVEHFTDMADFGRAKDDWCKNYQRLASP